MFVIVQLTVTQAAREYLDRYVQTKKETEKQLKQEANTMMMRCIQLNDKITKITQDGLAV